MSSIKVFGVVLAGGRGSRMGNRIKPLARLGSKCLIEHVIALAEPQVSRLILSVNSHQDRYEFLNLPLVTDSLEPGSGPMSGIVSAMLWLAANEDVLPEDSFLACFPGDVPRFPTDVVKTLIEQVERTRSDAAVFEVNGQIQPLFSIWRFSLLDSLSQLLQAGAVGPKLVLPEIKHSIVEINTVHELEFFNINSMKELIYAQNLINDA